MPSPGAPDPDIEIVASAAAAELRFDAEPVVTDLPTSIRRDAHQQPFTRSRQATLSALLLRGRSGGKATTRTVSRRALGE